MSQELPEPTPTHPNLIEEKSIINNLFEDLKERLSSPFISSFLISWLIINWKIVIALFWYDRQDLRNNNYDSYIHFIEQNTGWIWSLVFPFMGALIYCFGYPFLRDLIKIFNARRKTRANGKILDVSKDGVIDIMSYIKIKEDFRKLSKSVNEVIKEERQYSGENRQLTMKINQLEKENLSKDNDIGKWNNANNIGILNGMWNFAYLNEGTNKIPVKVFISDGLIREETDGTTSKRLLFEIQSYSCNLNSMFVHFTALEFKENQETKIFHSFALNFDPHFTKLVGKQDFNKTIEFIKISRI